MRVWKYVDEMPVNFHLLFNNLFMAFHYDMTFKRIGNKPNGHHFIYIIVNTLTAQLFLSQMDEKRGFFYEL